MTHGEDEMHPQRKPLMAANWKMYKTAAEAKDYVARLTTLLQGQNPQDLPNIVLCPPYTAIPQVAHCLLDSTPGIAVGAQTVSEHEEGAYTGDIAPRMLTEFGVRYVIIGHSERRQYAHETDAQVNAKVKTALRHGLTPIVCVGETLAQREAGQTDGWVQQQVRAALDGIAPADRQRLVLAYEPIWAIGTGKVCEADEANRVIGLIRQTAETQAIRVLYGGSVKPENIQSLMAQPEIDGGLVGGASLDPESFYPLIQAAMPVNV